MADQAADVEPQVITVEGEFLWPKEIESAGSIPSLLSACACKLLWRSRRECSR